MDTGRGFWHLNPVTLSSLPLLWSQLAVPGEDTLAIQRPSMSPMVRLCSPKTQASSYTVAADQALDSTVMPCVNEERYLVFFSSQL